MHSSRRAGAMRRVELAKALLILGSLSGLPLNGCFQAPGLIVLSRHPCQAVSSSGTSSSSSSSHLGLGCSADTSSGLHTDPLQPRPRVLGRQRRQPSISLARCSTGPMDAGLSLRRGLESLLGAGVVSHLLSVSSSPPHAVSGLEDAKIRYGTELLRSPISDALSVPINAGLESAQKELALLLMDDSRFEIIASLAEDAPPLPHSWSDAQLDELQSQSIADALRAYRDSLHESCPSGHDLARYLSASDAVRRHAVSCSGGTCLVLLPAVLLFSKSAPRGAIVSLDSEAGQVCINSDGSAIKGPVAVSAGWLSGPELLRRQGWADASLESERVQVSMSQLWDASRQVLGLDDAVVEQQRQVLEVMTRFKYIALPDESRGGVVDLGDEQGEEEGGGGGGGGGLAILEGGIATDDLGMFLQAVALTDLEIGNYGVAGCGMNIGETVPLSLEHEQRVGRLLSHLCFSLLGEYATSIEDDENLVERKLVEGAFAEAVKFRLSRKRCLKQCGEKAAAFVERPTNMATLRRPWKVNIKTSG